VRGLSRLERVLVDGLERKVAEDVLRLAGLDVLLVELRERVLDVSENSLSVKRASLFPLTVSPAMFTTALTALSGAAAGLRAAWRIFLISSMSF
jgi:hypothetical protein